jgi:hypothetical protein
MNRTQDQLAQSVSRELLGKTKRSSDTMSPFSSTHSNRTDRRDFFCAKGDK